MIDHINQSCNQSILLMTKISCIICMLNHFRSRVSAEVEQLCLLAKLCYYQNRFEIRTLN